MAKVWTMQTGWVFGVDVAKVEQSYHAMVRYKERINAETDLPHLDIIEGEILYDNKLIKQHLDELKSELLWRKRSV